MINLNKIVSVIEGYKQYFPEHWEDEKYKWEAVKHFQDNWDIEAENFGTMFKKATDKTFNLITFQGDAYTESAKLNITPSPDSILRIFMTYISLDSAVDIEPQELSTFERKGFTVVERGGTEINSNIAS